MAGDWAVNRFLSRAEHDASILESIRRSKPWPSRAFASLDSATQDAIMTGYEQRIGDTIRLPHRDRRALPPDGPDIGSDVPGGGAA